MTYLELNLMTATDAYNAALMKSLNEPNFEVVHQAWIAKMQAELMVTSARECYKNIFGKEFDTN